MKFHEALRQIVRLNGREVMEEGRRSLIGFLRKHHAFDDLPVIEDAMAYLLFPPSGGADGYAARLTRLSRLPDRRQYFAEAEKVKKSLAEERHFSRALADYAVDSVSYALDVTYSPETMADLGRRLEDLVSAERAPEGGRRQDTEGGDKGRCGSGRWKIRIFLPISGMAGRSLRTAVWFHTIPAPAAKLRFSASITRATDGLSVSCTRFPRECTTGS